MFINTAGKVTGNGAIGGSVTVDGTVSPGNSIRTLQIASTYTQNSGSTYGVQINGTGESDLIDITGWDLQI